MEGRDSLFEDMFRTGFDAPVEQVLYLDRKIVAHDLLQAIARVNRRARGKDCGYVVDDIGVARHLHEALGDYEDETQEPMTDVCDELPNLRDRHKRAVDVFLTRGIKSIRDVEACVDLLEDVKIRADFINKPLLIRRGRKRAIFALAHKILKIVFVLISRGDYYRDATVDYEAIRVGRNAPRWIRMLRKYGYLTA